MFYSYTALRNRYGTLTNNTTSSNLTAGDGWINDGIVMLLADRNDWPFLEAVSITQPIAFQQFYDLPYDYDKLTNVTVNNGNVIYVPDEVTSRELWDVINTNTTVTSNIPQYYYIYGGQIGFWPMPSTTSTTYSTGTIAITQGGTTVTGTTTVFTDALEGQYLKTSDGELYLIESVTDATHLELNRPYVGATITGATYIISSINITVYYKRGVKALSAADYTTGTITITNNSTVVTGSGTTFTSAMVGRYLKTTDGFWYRIASYTSATVIGLEKPYSSSVSGASFTIGEMSPLPDGYQNLPAIYAASQYWGINGEIARAREYERQFAEGKKALRTDWGNKTNNVVIGYEHSIINPNLTITVG